MNSSTHSVSPEDVMALLDGELSDSEARNVSAHLGHCAECAELAEQLRETSRSLSRWTVGEVPSSVEDSIESSIAKTATARSGVRNSRRIYAGWNRWVLLSGAAVAGVLLMVAVSTQVLSHRTQVPLSAEKAISTYIVPGAISRDKLEVRPRKGADSPMIARTVSLTMIVSDFAAARTNLERILAQHHAYSARLNVSTPANAARAIQASLRIPAPELDSALAALKRLGHVENESQSGEEVTKQHSDLIARLKNSRESEDRLRVILQQRAGKMSDVLEVEEQIARVRGEIEQMEAEQKALEHRVDFATVELQVTEEYKAQLGSSAVSASTRMRNALVSGYRSASEMLLGIVLWVAEFGPSLLIWAALLGVPGFLIWRRYRRAWSKL